MATESTDYLLGVSPEELERLRFQHSVWKPVTDRFFDRIGIRPGWKCLDVGSGPGFVAMDLLERVGPEGEVAVLEPSRYYLEWFRTETRRLGVRNVKFIEGTAENASLPESAYDCVFARWVIGFVPDGEAFIERLAPTLRPGGVIALQDYVYDGLSFFPRGGPMDALQDVIRQYWKLGGGDPDVAARIPAIYRRFGLELIDYHPNCLSGGPASSIVEWAHRFLVIHLPLLVERGVISQQQSDALWSDWLDHRSNPDAVFFSPIVVDMAGRKRGE